MTPAEEPTTSEPADPLAARAETPAQRVERIKREKAPWSILDDIRRYARDGFAAIPADDLNVRFRAWGLYTQGDGRATRGEEQPYFMMRLRTPNGLLTSEMVRTVADLADRYARGAIDVTNRQNFQLHWLRIEDVPTVWDELARVGWTSQGACGDNTRTVTGCPLAGVAHDELIDASAAASRRVRISPSGFRPLSVPSRCRMSSSPRPGSSATATSSASTGRRPV